ncbi:hypothetical protein ACJMK2_032413 [Sinanodonta woodiana]|uniref:C2H2-type domain-containing protein n=1 Tax=Sinanodonta woodiana TaxID=1069815 RepID=A0ABD3X573_SINWO
MAVKCAECGVSCDNCQLLLRHHIYHHGGKIRCEYCTYVVSRNVLYRMKDHYKRRHPGQEFQDVGQGKTSLSKSHSQKRNPFCGELKYGAEKLMEAIQLSRVRTPDTCYVASVANASLTHLRSPPMYAGDFQITPEMEEIVPPAMCTLFNSPVKTQPTGIVQPTPFTATSSGEGNALPKPSSLKSMSPATSASDPDKLHKLHQYNPTPMESPQQLSCPHRRVKLLRPVPTYLGKHINMEMSRQGILYEYKNSLPSMYYSYLSEAFVRDSSIYAQTPQAECLRRIRMKAKPFGQLLNSHHSYPAPKVRLKKAVIPGLSDNMLTSMWNPDPTVRKMESRWTMTEDERPLTRHMETQTEDFPLPIALPAKISDEKETQCSIFSFNLN